MIRGNIDMNVKVPENKDRIVKTNQQREVLSEMSVKGHKRR